MQLFYFLFPRYNIDFLVIKSSSNGDNHHRAKVIKAFLREKQLKHWLVFKEINDEHLEL